MMIATVAAACNYGRAAKFAAPDNERLFKQSTLLQILHQSGAGLIGMFAILDQIRFQVAVLVPGFVEEFDKPDAPFDQPPRQKAVHGKGRLAGFDAVHFEDVLWFFGKVHQVRALAFASDRRFQMS